MRCLPWIVLAVLAGSLSLPVTALAADDGDKRPNFVVFLTDDQGWGDLACYGHPEIKSPHLDRFASQGLRLTQCYAACGVCSPSRAAILTGRTPYRNGVWRWIPAGSQYHLRESEITIATLLKQRGYATCHAGKWHLNGKFNSPEQPQPNDHGFDWWLATQNNAAPHHLNPINYVRNGEAQGRMEGPSAIIAADEAITWLRETKPKDAPFYLQVWTHEPHLPIESAEQFMAPYAHLDDEGLRQHHGNITQLDAAFGKLMQALDELGYADNTLVIFTSDNGPEGDGKRGRTRGSTGGLRERKRHTHEGGIRVPGIIRWPGKIAPGTESETPVIGSDIFPTLCAIVGIPLPEDRIIDGTNLLPLFRGEPLERQQPLYWRNHLAPARYRVGLREGDWKIVGSDDLTQFELYNLAEDWQETTDLAQTHPSKFEEMKAKLIAHDTAVLDDGPDWWKREGQAPGRSAPELPPGEDRTGQFSLIQGATAHEDDQLGVRLVARQTEGIALLKLDDPITERATFAVRYTAATRDRVRNAMLVFGDAPDLNRLTAVGTAIGMNRHVAFRGGWRQLTSGVGTDVEIPDDHIFKARVTVDVPAKRVRATIDGKTLEYSLPADLKHITHYGYYVKQTTSRFGPIQVTRDR